MNELLTISEICRKLKISRQTLDRWRNLGIVTPVFDFPVRYDFALVVKALKQGGGGRRKKEKEVVSPVAINPE